jgi:type IV pilus assembly protein PilX
MHALRQRQRGAALVVGLILLAVLTLLAIAGMNTASTELIMAGNEQFRQQAFQASEAGIERQLMTLAADMAPDSTPNPLEKDITLGTNVATHVTLHYWGEGSVQGHSADNFIGFHYEALSTGTSSRNASAMHWQGTYFVNQVGTEDVQRPGDVLLGGSGIITSKQLTAP